MTKVASGHPPRLARRLAGWRRPTLSEVLVKSGPPNSRYHASRHPLAKVHGEQALDARQEVAADQRRLSPAAD